MCTPMPRGDPITSAMRDINLPATLILSGICFLGGFSRITTGQWTPQWYAYQLARAGNTAGTTQGWLIPALDIALGTLLLFKRTRRSAAVAITAMFSIGVYVRVAEGKSFVADAALFGLAALTLGTSW